MLAVMRDLIYVEHQVPEHADSECISMTTKYGPLTFYFEYLKRSTSRYI